MACDRTDQGVLVCGSCPKRKACPELRARRMDWIEWRIEIRIPRLERAIKWSGAISWKMLVGSKVPRHYLETSLLEGVAEIVRAFFVGTPENPPVLQDPQSKERS